MIHRSAISRSHTTSGHSICWMCGDDVDHETGHDCPMDDGS